MRMPDTFPVYTAVQSIGAGGPSTGLVASALCPMHGPVVQRSLSELLRQYRQAARMDPAPTLPYLSKSRSKASLPHVSQHGMCSRAPDAEPVCRGRARNNDNAGCASAQCSTATDGVCQPASSRRDVTAGKSGCARQQLPSCTALQDDLRNQRCSVPARLTTAHLMACVQVQAADSAAGRSVRGREWTQEQIAAAERGVVAVLYASAYGNTAALAQAISRGVTKAGEPAVYASGSASASHLQLQRFTWNSRAVQNPFKSCHAL